MPSSDVLHLLNLGHTHTQTYTPVVVKQEHHFFMRKVFTRGLADTQADIQNTRQGQQEQE